MGDTDLDEFELSEERARKHKADRVGKHQISPSRRAEEDWAGNRSLRNGLLVDEATQIEAFLEPNYEILHNPVSNNYLAWKEHILGGSIPWYYYERTIGWDGIDPDRHVLPLLSHCILDRPDWDGSGYPGRQRHRTNPLEEQTRVVLQEICHANGFHPEWYRMAVNFTTFSKSEGSPIHRDHEFPHWQLLIYLTDFIGGWTWVEGKRCPTPEADMVLTFDGSQLHHHEPPLGPDDRRLVLAATYKPGEIPDDLR
jgi:hypothetical protein